MLVELSIRDFILIDRLDLSFSDGLPCYPEKRGRQVNSARWAEAAIGGRGETGSSGKKKIRRL